MTSRYVAQAYLYGDSLKSYAVAIIVPDEDAVSVWAKENNVTGNFIELCTYDVRMMSSSSLRENNIDCIYIVWSLFESLL